MFRHTTFAGRFGPALAVGCLLGVVAAGVAVVVLGPTVRIAGTLFLGVTVSPYYLLRYGFVSNGETVHPGRLAVLSLLLCWSLFVFVEGARPFAAAILYRLAFASLLFAVVALSVVDVTDPEAFREDGTAGSDSEPSGLDG